MNTKLSPYATEGTLVQTIFSYDKKTATRRETRMDYVAAMELKKTIERSYALMDRFSGMAVNMESLTCDYIDGEGYGARYKATGRFYTPVNTEVIEGSVHASAANDGTTYRTALGDLVIKAGGIFLFDLPYEFGTSPRKSKAEEFPMVRLYDAPEQEGNTDSLRWMDSVEYNLETGIPVLVEIARENDIGSSLFDGVL